MTYFLFFYVYIYIHNYNLISNPKKIIKLCIFVIQETIYNLIIFFFKYTNIKCATTI